MDTHELMVESVDLQAKGKCGKRVTGKICSKISLMNTKRLMLSTINREHFGKGLYYMLVNSLALDVEKWLAVVTQSSKNKKKTYYRPVSATGEADHEPPKRVKWF